MEKTLLQEINGAFRMLEGFCETGLEIGGSGNPQAIGEQLQDIVKRFLPAFRKWSTEY
jgi:hypothetical protein